MDVTVLLPVRDAAATLPQCLASVAAQSLREYELLIVDDHSTDGSRAIVDAAARADSRIRVVENNGVGLVAALNTGLALARHDLLARIDADDLMLPQRLAVQAGRMRANPDIVVLGCQVEQFPAATDGAREYLRWQNSCCSADQIAADIYVEAPLAHPSVMMRPSVVMACGGYRDGDFPEDYELWLRLHHAGSRMEKVAEVLLRWRDTPGRLSRTDPRYRRRAFDRLRAGFLARDPRFVRNADAFVICGAGRRTRQRCAHLLDRGFRPRAWIDIDPRKIGNRLDGVPVVAPHWLDRNRYFALGYVASHGAREALAAQLGEFGYVRGEHYLLVG